MLLLLLLVNQLEASSDALHFVDAQYVTEIMYSFWGHCDKSVCQKLRSDRISKNGPTKT